VEELRSNWPIQQVLKKSKLSDLVVVAATGLSFEEVAAVARIIKKKAET
jgi:hypothetical protein